MDPSPPRLTLSAHDSPGGLELMGHLVMGRCEAVRDTLRRGVDPNRAWVRVGDLGELNPWTWIASLLLNDGTLEPRDVLNGWELLRTLIVYGDFSMQEPATTSRQVMAGALGCVTEGHGTREDWVRSQHASTAGEWLAETHRLALEERTIPATDTDSVAGRTLRL